MDNLDNDNFGLEDAEKIVSGIKNLATSLKNKKLTKAGQAIADAGDYWHITPYTRKLIPIPNYIIQETSGKGITQDAILNYPKQPTGTKTPSVLAGLQLASGYVAPVDADTKAMEQAGKTLLNQDAEAAGSKIKKALPYILGVAALGLIVYFISKK